MPVFFLLFLLYSCCLVGDPNINPPALYEEHLRFTAMAQEQRNNEMLWRVGQSWDRRTEELSLNIFNWGVCWECFSGFYGLPLSSWKKLFTDVKRGRVYWEHKNLGGELSHLTLKGWNTRVWMRTHFALVGDPQPDSVPPTTHLPPTDRRDVWKEMNLELNGECLSESAFLGVWRKEFPHVLNPRKQRLGKCPICSDLAEAIAEERNPEKRNQLKSQRYEHIKVVKADRWEYHNWRQKSRSVGAKVLDLIASC